MIRHPPKSPLFPYTPLSRSAQPARRALAQETPAVLSHPVASDASEFAVSNTYDTGVVCAAELRQRCRRPGLGGSGIDRKSTRLNSSHSQISYAVFCLKKKKT